MSYTAGTGGYDQQNQYRNPGEMLPHGDKCSGLLPATGPVARNLSAQEQAGLAGHVGAVPGGCIIFASGGQLPALLGAVRLEMRRRWRLIDENALAVRVDQPS